MKYITQGLGNGNFPEKKYEFDVIDKMLYIPGNYVGRDQMGDPHHPEQKDWINQGYWSWKNLADMLPYDYLP